MKRGKIVAPLIITILLAALYYRSFIWLGTAWIYNPYYQHGFLVPVISAVIAWKRRDTLRNRVPSTKGYFVLIPGLALYAAGYFLDIPSLLALSLLVVLMGLVLYFFGMRTARAMLFPMCFLLFMIPPPFLTDIGYWLQSIAIRGSAGTLSLFKMPVTIDGTEVTIGSSTFSIGLPCSGLNTLIALMALAAIYAFILSGPFYRKCILFCIAFPIAILANLLRLILLFLIGHRWGVQVAMNFFHDYSSILLFVVAILLLMLVGKLLRLRLILPEQRSSA